MTYFDIQKAFSDVGKSLAIDLGYDYVLNGYDDNGPYEEDPSKSYVRLDVIWNEKNRTNLDNGSGSLANHPLQVKVMVRKSIVTNGAGENLSFRAANALNQAQLVFYEGLELASAKVFKTYPSPLLFEDNHIGYALTVVVESIE